jgi:sugar phosphate isomerase/epimerase
MTNPASALAAIGVRIASGMMAMAGEDYITPASIRRTGGVVPDETWRANLAAARENAILAGDLGLDLVTFHAGFIPEGSEDPRRRVLLDRLRELASVFESRSVRIGLETGQERAPDLLRLLGELDCPSVGVNFDPGNMILYGMGDPVTALGELAPHVLQVHVKDALPPRTRGEWGTEVPVGEGAVDWAAFFAVLGQVPGAVDLMVEREAAEPHRGDIARAIRFLRHIDAARG